MKLNADKTELLWLGTSSNLRKLNDQGPSLSIAGSTVSPCTSVRLLGVTVTADLNLEKHVNNVCSKSFFQLRQLWKIRRSLDQVSASTLVLVHAFVTSRVDYCFCLFAGSTDKIIHQLQRVMNAAARVVTNTGKYDHGLSYLMHTELHWLDVKDRIQFRTGVMVYKCLHGLAPTYLSDLCTPVASLSTRSRLRSATGHKLVVPATRLSTYGRRPFAVAGPVLWNSLPDYLTDPEISLAQFRAQLKTFMFARY